MSVKLVMSVIIFYFCNVLLKVGNDSLSGKKQQQTKHKD